MSNPFARLEATGYAWMVSCGRRTAEEPLYAVALVPVDAHGLSDAGVSFIIEGDDIDACIDEAVIWSQNGHGEPIVEGEPTS